MKISILTLLLVLGAGAPALAQYAPPPATAGSAEAWSTDELDDLLAPIALYPDPLLAQILPATTQPDQIMACAQLLHAGRSPDECDAQPWDDSVKALARYPDVLFWLEGRPDWVKDVGDAFADNPDEVMNSVQQLRARAMAAGNLVATPEEQVTMDQGMIEILPADPDVICMPIYDPALVYVARPPGYVGFMITFGPHFRRGIWERHEIDWGHRAVWVNHDGWRHGVALRFDARAPIWRPPVGRVDFGRHAVVARQMPARPEYRGYPPQPRPVVVARPVERPREERPVVVAPPREERPVVVRQPEPPRAPPTPRGPIGAVDRGTAVRAAAARGQQSRQAAPGRPGQR